MCVLGGRFAPMHVVPRQFTASKRAAKYLLGNATAALKAHADEHHDHDDHANTASDEHDNDHTNSTVCILDYVSPHRMVEKHHEANGTEQHDDDHDTHNATSLYAVVDVLRPNATCVYRISKKSFFKEEEHAEEHHRDRRLRFLSASDQHFLPALSFLPLDMISSASTPKAVTVFTNVPLSELFEHEPQSAGFFEKTKWFSAYSLLNSTGSAVTPTQHFSPTVSSSGTSSISTGHHDHHDAHDDHAAHAATTSLASSTSHDDHDHKPWGKVMLACILTNIVALVGVVILGGRAVGLKMLVGDGHDAATGLSASILQSASAAFCAGALLAAAVFIMFFEASHLIQAGAPSGSSESLITFYWGTAIILGFIVTPVLQFFLLIQRGEEVGGAGHGKDAHMDSPAHSCQVAAPPQAIADEQVHKGSSKNTAVGARSFVSDSLVLGILLGDFFHNFTDGAFIAAAFLSCSSDKGWYITLGTVLHEISQEVGGMFESDFVAASYF